MDATEKALFERPEIASEPDLLVRREMATQAGIADKIAAARQRLEEIAREKDAYAFDVATTRGASPSRRHWDKLAAESAAIENELTVLEAGLKTSASRVAAAKGRAARTTAETEAQEAIEIAEQLRLKGVSCASHVGAFAREYAEFSALVDALRRLGYGPSNSRLIHLQSERCLSTALLPTRLTPQLGALPPSQRLGFDAVASQLAASVIAQARRVRGEAA